MKIIYDKNQLESAVSYVYNNNPYSNGWSFKHIRESILSMIYKGVDTEITCTGSMGVLVFTRYVDDEVYAQIHVDLSVGQEPLFVTEEI